MKILYFVDIYLYLFISLQEIDEMLAGSLTQEDEDAVLAELEAITQVSLYYSTTLDGQQLSSCNSVDLRHGCRLLTYNWYIQFLLWRLTVEHK